jgi:DNA-directed RNA polymerase specialized sigma24 family protein
MTDKKYKKDHDFAKGICTALQKGKKEAIEKVYNRFHPFFLAFAKNRLRTLSAHYEQDALSVANKYWIELLNGKYICNYKGNGSLKNYLMRRLKDRITDKKRKVMRTQEVPLSSDEMVPQTDMPDHPLESRLIEQIIYESLFELETESPRDAYYIKMYLDDMTYKEMARNELADYNPDEETVRKRTNAIKVRFTRKKTGSLARYEKILVRNMDKYGIDERDLLSVILEKSE